MVAPIGYQKINASVTGYQFCNHAGKPPWNPQARLRARLDGSTDWPPERLGIHKHAFELVSMVAPIGYQNINASVTGCHFLLPRGQTAVESTEAIHRKYNLHFLTQRHII